MKNYQQKQLLILPGSLRMNSSTINLVRFIEAKVRDKVPSKVFMDVGKLPHFNDETAPPAIIGDWREEVSAASAMIIVTPEYAYGVPGSLKNSLDWLVGTGNLSGKPVALITASTGGAYAHESMLHILHALNAKVTPTSSLLISHIRAKMNDDGDVTDDNTRILITLLLENFL